MIVLQEPPRPLHLSLAAKHRPMTTSNASKPNSGQPHPTEAPIPGLVDLDLEQIQLVDRWATYFPAPADESLDLLRASIAEQGIIDPLVLTDEGVLVDGHRRLQVARELALQVVPVVRRPFQDEQEIEEFVLLTNLQRRNLMASDWKYFVGKLYEVRKRDRRANLKQGTTSPKDHIDPSGPSAAEQVAKQCGISPATVKRHARSARAVDKAAKVLGNEGRAKVLAGSITPELTAAIEAANDVDEMEAAIEETNSTHAAFPANESKKRSEPSIPWAQGRTWYLKAFHLRDDLKRNWKHRDNGDWIAELLQNIAMAIRHRNEMRIKRQVLADEQDAWLARVRPAAKALLDLLESSGD